MRHTTLSVHLDVKPESAARLSQLIEILRLKEDKPQFGAADNFARLKAGIPTLHFMSMSVFEDPSYDPLFILEANFDGAPGPFWAQFEALMGEDMRDMLRCCKTPLDDSATLFGAVTAPHSRVPVTGYLEARSSSPSVFHHGNRGLGRGRILREAALFRDIRAELDAPEHQGPEPYRALAPKSFWHALREKMADKHPWLLDPVEPRFTKAEIVTDVVRLLGFICMVVIVLALPGLLAVLVLPLNVYLGCVALLFVASVVLSFLLRKPLPGTGVDTGFSFWRFLGRVWWVVALIAAAVVVVYVALGLGFVALYGALPWVDLGPASQWWRPVADTLLLALLSLFFVLSGLVLWLRYREQRDSSLDAPRIDEEKVRDMQRHEDWVTQNHMGSIVHIRPGVLRTLIIRTGHRGLGLLLRVATRTHGRLGSMRTVHFAHWAFLNNGSRLLFFSNYDQSWGSYLDDFIEKAHVGLTLAWGCGVGFPPTRFLIFDGASHGRRFKGWARHSRYAR